MADNRSTVDGIEGLLDRFVKASDQFHEGFGATGARNRPPAEAARRSRRGLDGAPAQGDRQGAEDADQRACGASCGTWNGGLASSSWRERRQRGGVLCKAGAKKSPAKKGRRQEVTGQEGRRQEVTGQEGKRQRSLPAKKGRRQEVTGQEGRRQEQGDVALLMGGGSRARRHPVRAPRGTSGAQSQ